MGQRPAALPRALVWLHETKVPCLDPATRRCHPENGFSQRFCGAIIRPPLISFITFYKTVRDFLKHQ